jgi:hypothetical protein
MKLREASNKFVRSGIAATSGRNKRSNMVDCTRYG